MSKIVRDMTSHIVKGITFVIPFIVLFSIVLTLEGNEWIFKGDSVSSFIFLLIIPLLTAAIANSIASKITVVPGLVLGYFINEYGIGFFGGIIGGLFLGYLVRCICNKVDIRKLALQFVIGYIVIGGISFGVSYLLMNYLVKDGLLLILDGVSDYVASIDTKETMILVVVLTVLTVVDLGGPFNKIAYTFIIQFFFERLYHIVGPVMISVSLAPLTVYVGMIVFKEHFNEQDKRNKKFALIGGLFGMTEGAMAVGFRRPVKIIIPLIIGALASTIFASLVGVSNTTLLTSVFGIFGVNNMILYILSYLIGMFSTVLIWFTVFNVEKQLQKYK